MIGQKFLVRARPDRYADLIQEDPFVYDDFVCQVTAINDNMIQVKSEQIVRDRSGNTRFLNGVRFWIDNIDYQLLKHVDNEKNS